MSERELQKRILALVAERMETNDVPTLDADLVRDLGLDSLARAELWVCVEDEFDLRISDTDAEALHSAQEIVSYITAARNA